MELKKAIAVLAAEWKPGNSPDFLIGYRVMAYDPINHRAISGADSRVTVPLNVGSIHRYPGQGMFLAPTKDYVLDYYQNYENNILMVYEFNKEDIIFGSEFLEDKEPEISVSKAKLVEYEILD